MYSGATPREHKEEDEDSPHLNLSQFSAISAWLRKRGKAVRPYLKRDQRRQLRECFDMIDTDGSGSINAVELKEVFKVWNKPMSELYLRSFEPPFLIGLISKNYWIRVSFKKQL